MTVTILDDDDLPLPSFDVSLSQPDGLKISRGTATATIIDDDEPSNRRRAVRR